MRKIYKIFALVLAISTAVPAMAQSVGSDYRIRTFVYGQNDVFKVVSIYGYQTVIELEEDERIITISVGNPNIFKIIPSLNRIYIKALQNGQQTNMSVVTDMRSYQFEVSSDLQNPEDMMYLVRFTYPEYIEDETDESVPSAQPMQLYSPVSLPAAAAPAATEMSFGAPVNLTDGFKPIDVQPSMSAMPSTSNILSEVPSGDAEDASTPLSMKYRDAGVR